MTNLAHRLMHVNARLRRKTHFLKENVLSRLFLKKKLNILFSPKPDWEPYIRNGFRLTKHTIVFRELDTEDIDDFDLVVPLTLEAAKYLSRNKESIKDNPIPIPTLESLLLCDDKPRFNRTLIEKGFGDLIPQMGSTKNYPYILKKSAAVWGGKSSFIIRNEQDEQLYAELLKHPDYFCQALIKGQREYATHIVFKNQKIVCALNIEYFFDSETPIKGKDDDLQIYLKIVPCRHLDLFSSILSHIGYEGLCCINYKIYNGQLYLLEINPRFGGSLMGSFFSFVRHVV